MHYQHSEQVKVQSIAGRPHIKRLNTESHFKLAQVGFAPGVRFDMSATKTSITLTVNTNGKYKVVEKRGRRIQSDDVIGSRIDMRNATVGAVFGQTEQALLIYRPGQLIYTLLPTQARAKARYQQLMERVIAGEPLRVGSLFSGVGSGDHGLATGLKRIGIDTSLQFVSDYNDVAINTLLQNLPDAHLQTRSANVDIKELNGNEIGALDILSMGPPCTRHSKLNTATRDAPEWAEGGEMFAEILGVLAQTDYSIPVIFLENVLPYFDSLSFSVLRRVLKKQRYEMVVFGDTHPTTGRYIGLDSHDFECIESRKRLFAVFICEELAKDIVAEDVNGLKKPNTTALVDYLDPDSIIPEQSYNIGRGLDEKAARTGWQNKSVGKDSTRVPCIPAGYYRIRTDSPLVRHDTQEGKYRAFTPIELQRIKQFPLGIFDGVKAKKDCGMMAGNGIPTGFLAAVFQVIGEGILRHIRQLHTAKQPLPEQGQLCLF